MFNIIRIMKEIYVNGPSKSVKNCEIFVLKKIINFNVLPHLCGVTREFIKIMSLISINVYMYQCTI